MLMWIYDFWNSEKCRKYMFLGGFAQIITILHRRVIEIYYNTTKGGGLPDLLQYYKGGVSGDPKFVLRNIWTAPKACVAKDLVMNK